MPDTSAPSVGEVETHVVRLFTEQDPLRMAHGLLAPVDVAYETYGHLNDDKDNAVFVCHALTGDAHAAGFHAGDDQPGWWDNLIGPGKPLDTDRFFVICPNLLGGCQGTTGPASLDPATGQAYGLSFPILMMSDLVAVHRALLRHLGVTRLLAAIGGSLGGMQVLEWALHFPDEIANAIVIASSSRLTAQNIAFSAVARRAIMSDPHFEGGHYAAAGTIPETGLAIARMMAHITYLSEDALSEKFGREPQYDHSEPGFGIDFAVESYLAHQGRIFLERFDALSYLYLSRVMDYFDPFSEPDVLAAIRRRPVRWLLLSFDSDWRFGTDHSRRILRRLERVEQPVSFREIASPWGHDSFLLPGDTYHATVRAYLDCALEENQGTVRLTQPPNAAIQENQVKGTVPASAPGENQPFNKKDSPLRKDLALVADLIPDASRVLDLGCDRGDLLAHLIAHKGCRGTGVEIAPDAVLAAMRRGIPLIDVDIDRGLGDFADDSYDVVVLSRTLQTIHRPETVLREMGRIGRRLIVSVPNFGWWGHRLRLLHGRMPMSKELPYHWYDTPNLRFTTLTDLQSLFDALGFGVERRITTTIDGEPLRVWDRAANLLAGAAVYVLTPWND